MKDSPLTENCKKALIFLQEDAARNDNVARAWVGADLAAAAEIKGIHPVMNSLVKRALVEKGTETRPFENKKTGVVADKDYVTYRLTPAGLDFVVE